MSSRIAVASCILGLLLAACASGNRADSQTFDQLLTEYTGRAAIAFVERDEQILECLLLDGFDRDLARNAMNTSQQSQVADGSVEQLTAGLRSEEAIAGVIGYGFAPVAVFSRASEPVEDELPDPAEGASHRTAGDEPTDEALQRCRDEVVGVDFHPTSLVELSALTAAIDEQVKVDERVLTAQSTWSTCLGERGIGGVGNGDQLIAATQIAFEAMSARFPMQIDIAAAGLGQASFDNSRSIASDIYGRASDWNDLADREIQIALTDLACRRIAALDQIEGQVRDEITREQQAGGS